jgi:threonine dehydrogenase-like Zn-dependent dehydrogenase
VELVDSNPRRAAIANSLGAQFALPDAARGSADVVLHASGTEAGLGVALRLAGFEATVIELSWYGDRPVRVPLGEAFHSQRLTLKSSQVGAIAAPRRARRTLSQRLQLALSLLTDAGLDALINSEGRFADLPDRMQQLSAAPGDVIMHRVRYD